MKVSGGLRSVPHPDSELEEIVALHGPRVLATARRILRNEAMAEEVAQDTFLAFWRNPSAFVPQRGSLGVWLASVARNKAIDLVRKEERRSLGVSELADLDLSELLVDGPDADLAMVVRQAMRDLTYLQREALFLAYFEGLTYREVALRLGVPEGTAKTRLRDALARLRMALHPLHAA